MKTYGHTFVVVIAVVTTVSALAHEGATGVVKERMLMMKDISSQMKTLGQMIKGEIEFDSNRASSAAQSIANHGQDILALFPEGSVNEPSKSLVSIWQEWGQFERLVEEFGAKANELAEVSQTASVPTDIISQFRSLGQTCTSYHQDYRKPDLSRKQKECSASYYATSI